MVDENTNFNTPASGSEDPAHPQLPKKIGPYKIEALLNTGGMSYLYLATHPETKEPITIKVLSQKYVSHPEVIQRFLNEAEIISITNHPNIIKMYGHGEWEKGLYIAMEFVEGTSLRQYISQHPLSLKRALGIIIDIAYALCHLHTHGVIHRDLKPENILVTKTGSIKVIDFGIAQLLEEKGPPGEPTRKKLIGTPIYISPEQKENPETASYPSDIYSLGIISYELILGKRSHGHLHLSLMPKGVQHILHKCLQPKPKDRYQDVVDFIADISAYLNSPTLEKDRMTGDHLSELSEELRQIQTALVPATPPNWPGIEIGIATYSELKSVAVYYDFFFFSEATYGVFIGESSAKGAEGYIAAANLRGMLRALCAPARNPNELIPLLNELLLRDQLGPIFNLNFLLLKPNENRVEHISCGYSNLWSLSARSSLPQDLSKNPIAVGIDAAAKLEMTSLSWNLDDILLINTFAPSPEPGEEIGWEINEAEFIQAIKDNAKVSPQQLVDNILRKVRLTESEAIQDRTISLISVKRINSSQAS